jgi:hypothetical protein
MDLETSHVTFVSFDMTVSPLTRMSQTVYPTARRQDRRVNDIIMIRVGSALGIFRIRDIFPIGFRRIDILKAWKRFMMPLSSYNNENMILNPNPNVYAIFLIL